MILVVFSRAASPAQRATNRGAARRGLPCQRLIEASLDPLVAMGRDGEAADANKPAGQVAGASQRHLVVGDFAECSPDPGKARDVRRHALLLAFVENCTLARCRAGPRTCSTAPGSTGTKRMYHTGSSAAAHGITKSRRASTAAPYESYPGPRGCSAAEIDPGRDR